MARVRYAVDQHRIGEVGTAGGNAGHVRAGEIGGDQTRAAQIDRVVVGFLQSHVAADVAFGNHAIAHVGILQARAGQIGAAQRRTTQVGAIEPCAMHHCAAQIGAIQHGTAQVGVGEIGRLQIAAGEVGAGKIGAGHGQMREIAKLKDRPFTARQSLAVFFVVGDGGQQLAVTHLRPLALGNVCACHVGPPADIETL